jgi:Zn-dependent M28 family amino/carboxypeptidase
MAGLTSCVVLGTFAAFRGCVMIGADPRAMDPLPLAAPDTRTLAERLRGHVTELAGAIGERNLVHPEQLKRAEHYLAAQLARAGHVVRWQTYVCRGHEVSNLEVEIKGTTKPGEILVVGAHYDSINHRGVASPGANDNASGTAAVLELARMLKDSAPGRTIRLVLFTNEEPPYFWTDEMGSLVYARACKQRGDAIYGMISVETIGYYRDEKGSQDYPPLAGVGRSDVGNFIAFVGPASNGGGDWVERCTAAFRAASEMPAEGAALPSLVPRINSSDHWSFWKQGWPALMVTDTAPYRYPYYHKAEDTPDKLDYERMARVVEGVAKTVLAVAGDERSIDTLAGAGTQGR